MPFEFKKLELKSDQNWIKRIFASAHTKKTLLYMVLGAIAGFLFFYITEGRQMSNIGTKDILNSMILGTFVGFFITNSPCARGRC